MSQRKPNILLIPLQAPDWNQGIHGAWMHDVMRHKMTEFPGCGPGYYYKEDPPYVYWYEPMEDVKNQGPDSGFEHAEEQIAKLSIGDNPTDPKIHTSYAGDRKEEQTQGINELLEREQHEERHESPGQRMSSLLNSLKSGSAPDHHVAWAFRMPEQTFQDDMEISLGNTRIGAIPSTTGHCYTIHTKINQSLRNYRPLVDTGDTNTWGILSPFKELVVYGNDKYEKRDWEKAKSSQRRPTSILRGVALASKESLSPEERIIHYGDHSVISLRLPNEVRRDLSIGQVWSGEKNDWTDLVVHVPFPLADAVNSECLRHPYDGAIGLALPRAKTEFGESGLYMALAEKYLIDRGDPINIRLVSPEDIASSERENGPNTDVFSFISFGRLPFVDAKVAQLKFSADIAVFPSMRLTPSSPSNPSRNLNVWDKWRVHLLRVGFGSLDENGKLKIHKSTLIPPLNVPADPVPVVLDTGSALSYLPRDLVNNLFSHLGLKTTEGDSGIVLPLLADFPKVIEKVVFIFKGRDGSEVNVYCDAKRFFQCEADDVKGTDPPMFHTLLKPYPDVAIFGIRFFHRLLASLYDRTDVAPYVRLAPQDDVMNFPVPHKFPPN